MKKLISCICIFFLLTGCTGGGAAKSVPSPEPSDMPEPTPTASVGDPAWDVSEYGFVKTDEETGDTLLNAKYILPQITNASGVPQWTAINEYYAAEGETLQQGAEEMANNAQDNYDFDKAMNYEFFPYADEQNYEMKLNTDQYVSILRTHYEYAGGAHGGAYYFSDTFNMATGELMELDDVFTVPSGEYDKRILAEVKELAALMVTEDGERLIDESALESTFDHNCFYLTDDALVIYYQTYSLGPYAMGAPEFPIPRNALEDILISW